MAANQNRTSLQRMRELIDLLGAADIAYYRDDNPSMTDREYDAYTEELQRLELQTGLILSGSPTQRVSGEILEELASVPHTKPMLSANKTKSIEDLIRFARGHAVVISWKMDGLTLVLRYENGELYQAITRGRDGIIGEDVTHTVWTFLNVPLSIPTKESFEVRGEGVISWKNFEQVNLSLGGDYRSFWNAMVFRWCHTAIWILNMMTRWYARCWINLIQNDLRIQWTGSSWSTMTSLMEKAWALPDTMKTG